MHESSIMTPDDIASRHQEARDSLRECENSAGRGR